VKVNYAKFGTLLADVKKVNRHERRRLTHA
jgi:hypothetical protein